MPQAQTDPAVQAVERKIALYRQKRNYTCGPSSVMMVMSALDPNFVPNEVFELEIWREATTIHAGCGPLGLALTLKRRGLAAHALISHDQTFLESRAANDVQKEAVRILQERDLKEAAQTGIVVAHRDYTIDDLARWMNQGWYPIVMLGIDFEGKKIAHWSVVTGVTAETVSFNDPLKEADAQTDMTTVDHDAFLKISQFGPDEERAVVLAGSAALAMLPPPFEASDDLRPSN
ncbi:peptidase C39 family protein [Microvirga sp. VF16]|uniref:peptidase C39 family protein n=1 Tax=Microvirga sp. VF16 TaxID=2807101 RepID=UPI00193E9DBE|nr:peptidase C39 family protein [Microvirga sp. VF16]QRM32808.1 peptidase C39 family protein [Microvirga sp. VF16]